MEERRPKVGVGVVIVRDGKILMGKRRNCFGDGSWSIPGGHLEFGESIEECARREVLEETGLTIANLRQGPYTNNVHIDSHYVSIFMYADYISGEPQVLEPLKNEKWLWVSPYELPEPLFLPIINFINNFGKDAFLRYG